MSGFPNLFVLTGPGSPSVTANLFVQNEYQIDWVADLLSFMKEKNHTMVEPSADTVRSWTAHCAAATGVHIKAQIQNYQVHIAPDGTRSMMPYMGGVARHYETLQEEARTGYPGFMLN